MLDRVELSKTKTMELPDSLEAINDHFYEQGWTDGLPIIPPTPERVERMLAGMPWRNPDDVIGVVPPAMGLATLRNIAVNAVMAGCQPSYLPVIVAALSAVLEKAYGLAHRQTTTHAGAPLLIVNGPVVRELGLNYGNGVFGPGWRANATIGRGLRLALVNLGGAVPAEVDFCQHAHPGKYTYCIAEHEAANPWEPLHMERGFKADESVVTVVNAEAPHSMTENVQTDPIEIMRTFADSMSTYGGNNLYSQGHPVLVFGPENAQHVAAAGWKKLDVQKAIFEMARKPWGMVKSRGKSKGPVFPVWVDQNDENSMVPIINEPRDLIVVVAGGAGGKSMWCPTAGAQSSQRQQADRAARVKVPAQTGKVDAGAAPTFALGQFAASLQGDRLPGDVKTTLGELFLDYIRVASIGAGMPWSAWSDAYMAHLGGHGRAAVLFQPQRRDPVRAAFLNATYAGSIDADDTHVGSMLHPGSIVFSAALALADEVGAGGKDFIAAVAAGYEAMIRIGLSIQPSHFARGFQSTATCGGFGAAVAAARLAFNGQPHADRKIASSIGLVASFSGGLTQFYKSGSTVKRIHAARAAENGVAAALLARQGFTGPEDILEGANGFARAYADAADFGVLTKGLGSDYLLREVTVKGHACSARVQAAVEGILDLCRKNRINSDEVAEIFVGIPSVILGRLTIPKPIDLQAAQMSLPHSAALAVAMAAIADEGFALSVAEYESSLDDARVKQIESRVRCEVDPEVEAATTAEAVPARVTITMKDGASHSIFVPAPKGSPSRPFTHADHVARFRRELTERLTERICDELVEIAENLADLDQVERITSLLAVARGN